MKKRWLIRSFFIALLVLCAGAWVVSYWQEIWVNYSGWNHYRAGGVDYGSIYYHEIYDSGYTGGWKWGHMRTDPEMHAASYLGSTYKFGGFAFTPYTSRHRYMEIPLWLPTLLFLGINWLVWWKTRPKVVGRAFPVEPAAKSGESKP